MCAHWNLYQNKTVTAFVKVDNSHTPIASVLDGEERPVRQMLRYAELGEECERLCDKLLGGALSDAELVGQFHLLVTEAVKDVIKRDNPIRCPEITALKENDNGR